MKNKVNDIDAHMLKRWMDNDEVILIDVREQYEHEHDSIHGAILLPSGQVTVEAVGEIISNVSSKNGDKKRKLVFHCQKGGRSSSSCKKVIGAPGMNCEIYNLSGGMDTWKNLGYASTLKEGNKGFFLPVDRQTQIVIGVMLVTFSTLAYFYSGFVFATALIGAGLIIAGSTGVCMLAILIARMPWNRSTPKSSGICSIGSVKK